MKNVIVVLPGENETSIRERITAALQTDFSPPEIWWFDADRLIAAKLPIKTVRCLPAPEVRSADCYLPLLNKLFNEFKPQLMLFGAEIMEKDLCAALASDCFADDGCAGEIKTNEANANETNTNEANAGIGGCALGVTSITRERRGLCITRVVQDTQLEDSFLFTGYPCFFSVVKERFKPTVWQGKPELLTTKYSFPEQNRGF